MKNILWFTLGFITGGFVVKKYLESQDIQGEVLDIDEVRKEMKTNKSSANDLSITIDDFIDYSNIIKANKYSNDTDINMKSEQSKDIYIIPEEEFAIDDEYDTESITYFEDGKFAFYDEMFGGEIEDIREIIGNAAVDTMIVGDVSELYVRNEKLKKEYEILRSLKTYEEACSFPNKKHMINEEE